jgi:hypothetical protein
MSTPTRPNGHDPEPEQAPGLQPVDLLRSLATRLADIQALAIVVTYRDGSCDLAVTAQPVAQVSLAGLLMSGHALDRATTRQPAPPPAPPPDPLDLLRQH